jgi:hypothetical protein
LTVAAQVPSTGPRNRAFVGLLRLAFRHGRPTPKQLFAFGLIWLLPHGLRSRIRARLGRRPAHREAQHA